ncbi:MAG: AbrB family transcriptional regulator [Anaerolineae bacterium CG1_02_58_13]|jgi:AbrB family looped-hinge helix DNA binding protein|nr:AbrB/MazE/SpoVT family DNA-binding domain-containing protein [Chloroflexota bacterium]OIN89369.1 MAG: AbrB family transcriptional regulator [Anaerolineae bacterium CG1_02_58_13]
MDAVTVSPKYQVVIPLKVRERMRVKPGQKMHVIAYDNMVVFIPVRPIKQARGSLKGIDTRIERDEEDRV